jgi:hypothetical protein
VTLENSKTVKLALTWVVTTQIDEIKLRSYNHTVYSGFFSLWQKCKAEDYHAVYVQYLDLSCFLSAKQMTESKQTVHDVYKSRQKL